MIGNSNNRLFGGANKSIIEAYEKMQTRKLEESKKLEEAKSVSDAECSNKKLDDSCSMKKEATLHEEIGHESLVARLKEDGLNHIETQDQGAFNVSIFSSENLNPEKIEHLNSMVAGQGELKVEGDNVKLITKKAQSDFEAAPQKQIYESNDYVPFMNRQAFESAASKHSLNLVANDEHHTEALDGSGDLKGWWNGHTGVGYIRKDCGQCPLESNTLKEFFEELNDSHLMLVESAEDDRFDEESVLESVVRRMPEHLKEEYVNLDFEGKTALHHDAYDKEGSKGETKIGRFHWEQWRANARAMIKKGAE